MIRTGLGFDAHSFDEDRPLVLAGVRIPDAPGLAGHSDADVVSHAIADALLGAAALGDLGERFPNDDRWRDAASLDILRATHGLLSADGWSVVNLDATVAAERPRLTHHRSGMIAALCDALSLEPPQVSVKFTTTDGLGFVGRAEGIAALAVVTIARP